MKQVNYLKSLFICLALFCGFSTASAQDDQQVLDVVEQMPSFAPCTYEITRMKVEQTKDGPKTVQVKEEFNNPGGFKGLQSTSHNMYVIQSLLKKMVYRGV